MLMARAAETRASVFPVAPLQLQFTCATGLAALALLILGDVGLPQRLAIIEGVTIIALACVAGFGVSDGRRPDRWILLVPALDTLGIGLMIREVPAAGLSTLLLFPVIWLATSYSARTLVVGLGLMLAAVWLARVPGIAGAPTTRASVMVGVSSSCALGLVATMTWWTRRRSDAQHVLLRRQASMLEGAFDRASVGEDTVRHVLDAVQFAVLGFDAAGHLTTSNRAARQLVESLSLPPTSDLAALPFYHQDGFTPVAPADFPLTQVLAGGSAEDAHYWLGHPGEARAALAVSTRVLRDRQGRITQIVLVANDVTAEYEALQARDDLAASVSHELRTPLSSIIGYIDLALDTPDLDPDLQEQLEVVAKNSDRMLVIVNDLLAHREREATGALTVTKVPMDLVPVVFDSVAAIMPMAHDRLISVNVDVPPRLPLVGDALRLRQVIDNLLSNAIKYNREGGEVEVLGSLRHDATRGDLVEVSVSDTGRGMTSEETRRLFERFYRASSVRGTSIRGTGLGLNISRDLVELHQGTIRVESVPDVGTTMTVVLPGIAA
ncbi:MAG: ATP-binding protein [Nocardioides sp.]|uniref:sensor histidine kinase n=1 Tax=Nocardioides sp. TaxID=35761 RepID=UPI0039E6A7A4